MVQAVQAISEAHAGVVPPRPFEIRIEKMRDNEVALEVWQESINGWPNRRADPVCIARLKGAALHFAWEHVMLLLHRHGVKALALSPSARNRTLRLPEEIGVRAALLAAALAPLRKPQRIEAMAAAISRVSYEEACYWYAHIRSEHGNRALRALRLLLAPE